MCLICVMCFDVFDVFDVFDMCDALQEAEDREWQRRIEAGEDTLGNKIVAEKKQALLAAEEDARLREAFQGNEAALVAYVDQCVFGGGEEIYRRLSGN
jgi:hypothetical protein